MLEQLAQGTHFTILDLVALVTRSVSENITFPSPKTIEVNSSLNDSIVNIIKNDENVNGFVLNQKPNLVKQNSPDEHASTQCKSVLISKKGKFILTFDTEGKISRWNIDLDV